MWHAQVIGIINALLTLFAVVLGVVAFIHCATQRSDAFPAIGTLQKAAWLAIIGIATVMTLLTNTRFLLFHMITIGAAALYLLDVRPGLKDATNGNGNW